jgi:hypothetical protein
MSIPNPPAEHADPWFDERNAFDVAVKTELEGRLSDDALSATYVRLAGTTPGSVPVVKPFGDDRAGVWEFTHNDDFGYMYHLLAGTSFGGASAAILAIGLDNGAGGAGILIANKKGNRGMVVAQQATINSATAYGILVTNSSTLAPAVRIEQNVSGAADALQLVAFGAPTATQNLLYVSDTTGEAWSIRAATGELGGQRTLKISNKAAGAVANYLQLSTSGSANSSNTRKSYHGAVEDVFYGATGGAGQYYPYKILHTGSTLRIQTAANIISADPLAPLPSEFGTASDHIVVSHANGLTLAAAAGKLGFYGATAVVKATLAAAATDAATTQTLVNDIRAKLIALGLFA